MLRRLKSFFQFGNSSSPQPANETVQEPVVGRHSPTEIAILRCASRIFFNTSAESAREKLESKLEENRANDRDIRVIRRLPDAEVAGYYDELLPLLCIGYPTKNNPVPEDRANNRKRSLRMWVKAVNGKVYQVNLFPARKHPGSSTSDGQQRLVSTTSVVCGWKLKLHSSTIAEYREWRASQWLENLVDVLGHNEVLSLQVLASFAVVHQVGGNVDGLWGLLPSTVIADLKGRWENTTSFQVCLSLRCDTKREKLKHNAFQISLSLFIPCLLCFGKESSVPFDSHDVSFFFSFYFLLTLAPSCLFSS